MTTVGSSTNHPDKPTTQHHNDRASTPHRELARTCLHQTITTEFQTHSVAHTTMSAPSGLPSENEPKRVWGPTGNGETPNG